MFLQGLSSEQLLGRYGSMSKWFLDQSPCSFLAEQMWAGVLGKGGVLPLHSATKTRPVAGGHWVSVSSGSGDNLLMSPL